MLQVTMKRPTQKDVARRAGVSRATVSYVLNDQVDLKVPISVETRQRVMDAVAELGYEPDARAQSLARGRTNIIGVIYPINQNPFFWGILSGISSELQLAGYSLHLSQLPMNAEQEITTLRELIQQHVDGFILLTSVGLVTSKLLKYLRESGRPVVEMTATASEFDHVVHGYASGTRQLLAHLRELRHRRIGLIYGVLEEAQGYDRLSAYREVMQEAGLWSDGSLEVHCGDLLEDGYNAAQKLLTRPDRPTALLVINDLLAIGAIRAALDLGLNIPGDLSIGSFDDTPFANFTYPRLTTVSGDAEASGRETVRLLLRRFAQPHLPTLSSTVSVRLIIRESTGPAPF